MKPSTILCYLAAAATATAAAARRPPRPRPAIMEGPKIEDAPAPQTPEVIINGCLSRCLQDNFSNAGCGRADDWDCLCRPGNKLPWEVRTCIRANCRSDADKGNERGIEIFHCGETLRPPPPSEERVPVSEEIEEDDGH
ncbi:hypothetical protein B0T16DRAFT_122611 [Cercophora newfieldiana]|uniref:CFEM domain-containing protein n=1 Tax=Cercophora newfieldiana TaxID=92897 RepID=A0AA40CRS6_9PEZI|nr:hypothetical protein B0T16DRAFT_122611 [Cercophora newfieldiana]